MAVLPFVLSALAVGEGDAKYMWDSYKKTPSNTPYDIAIRINSLTALETSGWEILLSENARDTIPQNPTTSENSRGSVVAVLGLCDRGKSYLLNQFCDIVLPNENLIHTEGISITALKKTSEKIIFIDTAGTDTSISKDKLKDQNATEGLLKEIALHLCSVIIIVVNRLRATDQTYIDQVLTHTKNCDKTKNIIIVHNFMNVETIDDATKLIEKEVKAQFAAKEHTLTIQNKKVYENIRVFRSKHLGINLHHFILTKHGYHAATIWNNQSVKGILNTLETDYNNKRDLNIIDEMIQFINTKLPQLLIINNENENNVYNGNQLKYEVQKHTEKPYIVLSQRKDMKDLEENPYKLTLSSKLVYDDAGYFIGNDSMNKAQWQPRYSLYETNDDIYAIIELAGLKKEDIKIKVGEEAITIEGHRDDFKQLLSNADTLQEIIPMGQFKLDIRFSCRVEHREAKLESHDGLFKIKCPKNRATATYL
ncbi:unnamed protein product [Adineta steineri]|uniref:SHSP domain-containing protein n=1 Tax=Adineta steineri TaxID=433720 RepID=A0A815IBV9_9BILA|nr:unnamed protein product [Adineta steineri]CAF3531083.1 unnamed protein product [Adineta steineri]